MFLIKLLNLIPQKEKNKKRKTKIMGISLVAILLLGSILLYPSIQLNLLEQEIAEAEQTVEKGQGLHDEISELRNSIVNTNNTLSNIRQESLPLNYFMLFLSVDVPDDVKVYQVVSETYLEKDSAEAVEEEEEKEEEEENGDGNVVPDVVETHNQDIVIKGSAEKSKSIADLMHDLEEEGYVDYVDIERTASYSSGVSEYELFELYIKIK